MKRIIALSICIASILFILCSCKSNSYKPVESTELEATTVMTMSVDGKSYDVKYELYRALFLSYKNKVDGGDSSVWTGPEKDKYIAEIDKMIIDSSARIFSAFAVCEKINYNLYSEDVELKIREFIRQSVEGGSYGGVQVQGHGSYDKYLAALKEANLNYSAQVLLYRYAIAIEAIEDYYIGTASPDNINSPDTQQGAISYTEDDIRRYYNSDECVRVLRLHLQADYITNPDAYLKGIRDDLVDAALAGESAVVLEIQSKSLTSASEIQNGYIIGRHNLDKGMYGEMTDAAFALNIGEVSEAIEANNGTEKVYYILYRAEKSDEHFENCYSSIAYIYLKDTVGGILDDSEAKLIENTSVSDFLKNLDRSSIRME